VLVLLISFTVFYDFVMLLALSASVSFTFIHPIMASATTSFGDFFWLLPAEVVTEALHFLTP
jgi:hypothetical protein